MRVLFFGVYGIGVASLRRLLERGVHVVGVVTKPPAPLGPQPVAEAAKEGALPLFAPLSPRDSEFVERIRNLQPTLIAVAGYHKILPRSVLAVPLRGVINLHLSLLPRYRGPCPWKWAVANGEAKTGATVHVVDHRIDGGDILGQEETPVGGEESGGSLFERLSVLGGRLLARVVEALQAGPVERRSQDERFASYYGAPTEADARIDWGRHASRIAGLVRGFCPRPGAWTSYAGLRVGVLKASVKEGLSAGKPGTLLKVSRDALWISAGRGVLGVHEIAVNGRTVRDMGEAARVLSLREGTGFDDRACRRGETA